MKNTFKNKAISTALAGIFALSAISAPVSALGCNDTLGFNNDQTYVNENVEPSNEHGDTGTGNTGDPSETAAAEPETVPDSTQETSSEPTSEEPAAPQTPAAPKTYSNAAYIPGTEEYIQRIRDLNNDKGAEENREREAYRALWEKEHPETEETPEDPTDGDEPQNPTDGDAPQNPTDGDEPQNPTGGDQPETPQNPVNTSPTETTITMADGTVITSKTEINGDIITITKTTTKSDGTVITTVDTINTKTNETTTNTSVDESGKKGGNGGTDGTAPDDKPAGEPPAKDPKTDPKDDDNSDKGNKDDKGDKDDDSDLLDKLGNGLVDAFNSGLSKLADKGVDYLFDQVLGGGDNSWMGIIKKLPWDKVCSTVCNAVDKSLGGDGSGNNGTYTNEQIIEMFEQSYGRALTGKNGKVQSSPVVDTKYQVTGNFYIVTTTIANPDGSRQITTVWTDMTSNKQTTQINKFDANGNLVDSSLDVKDPNAPKTGAATYGTVVETVETLCKGTSYTTTTKEVRNADGTITTTITTTVCTGVEYKDGRKIVTGTSTDLPVKTFTETPEQYKARKAGVNTKDSEIVSYEKYSFDADGNKIILS